MANILVIYHTRQYRLRASQRDHLFSFKRYGKEHTIYYINIFVYAIPGYFKDIKFDLVIFSWSFLGSRFDRQEYLDNFKKIESVKEINCIKVAMPQDEFSNTDLLCETIDHFNIDIVYSVSPETEWVKLYKTTDFSKVAFFRVLTGYLDERTVAEIARSAAKVKDRDIDVGFRSGAAAYWGRFNLIKFEIAERFLNGAEKYVFTTDIAFGWNNFLLGDKWYDFLLRCKYMPGIEGGSSIIDWDGSLYRNVNAFLKDHPGASFDDVEKACIPPGKDGEINVVALSPRHLEACASRTCQILVEGEYNNVLIPGKHYISLKKDFSNLDEVFAIIKEDKLRNHIVEAAYTDIIESGKFSYLHFVQFVINNSILDVNNASKNASFRSNVFLLINKVADRVAWLYVGFFSWGRNLRDLLKKITPIK